jgi:hypothetical protein
VRRQFEIRGISATKPDPAMRNSIQLRALMDDIDWIPGMVEADTVVHCGPTLRGECARTLTITDMKTGYTLNRSTHNNAFVNIGAAIGVLIDAFPMPVSVFDSDDGSEFINTDLIKWLAGRGIEQTRSRPYMKNDQATVESKNNHIVRRHAFHYRYDTSEELDLPEPVMATGQHETQPLHRDPQTHRLPRPAQQARQKDQDIRCAGHPVAAPEKLGSPQPGNNLRRRGTTDRDQPGGPHTADQPHPAAAHRPGEGEDTSAERHENPRPGQTGTINTQTRTQTVNSNTNQTRDQST